MHSEDTTKLKVMIVTDGVYYEIPVAYIYSCPNVVKQFRIANLKWNFFFLIRQTVFIFQKPIFQKYFSITFHVILCNPNKLYELLSKMHITDSASVPTKPYAVTFR